jgi:hypothetical protein
MIKSLKRKSKSVEKKEDTKRIKDNMNKPNRKLGINQISQCHPKQKTRKKKCLPVSVYSELSKKLNVNQDSIFRAVGCNENAEHCLLDKVSMDENKKKELRKEYLRPKKPKGWDNDPDMWLDNYNIIHVMKQYEEAFPWFKFLGVFPIDFSAPDPYKRNISKSQCLYKETCNLKLKEEYQKGVRGIGMIFNLDPHYKGGSHWVALYINLHNINKPFVGYFDSYGYKVPDLIARLMRSFKLEIEECELGYNARRFQYGNSECGMFSMYFIICMIAGISFKDFCKDSVNDSFMLELRNNLFSK